MPESATNEQVSFSLRALGGRGCGAKLTACFLSACPPGLDCNVALPSLSSQVSPCWKHSAQATDVRAFWSDTFLAQGIQTPTHDFCFVFLLVACPILLLVPSFDMFLKANWFVLLFWQV